jgi:hypothetical protein
MIHVLKPTHSSDFILKDFSIIVLSILVAFILVDTHTLTNILTSTKELEILGSFVAGLFFTSIFTTAPAIVTLGDIAQSNSLVLTALFGACGAVLGDLVIFRFIRDRLSGHLLEILQHQKGGRRIKALLKLRYFRWLTFFAGGLIIASPFPDELGITLLGFAKAKTSWFVPISFIFNFIGISLIGLVARAI